MTDLSISEVVELFQHSQFVDIQGAMDSSVRRHPGARTCHCPAIDALRVALGYLRDAGLLVMAPQASTAGHVYLSTACQHDRCGECRQTCKFCSTTCTHDCHES